MPLGRQNIDLDESLRRLSRGGLPTRASLRLAEEAGPNKKLFTSDLSVNEFLLTSEIKAQPISQVMGSSIYHLGKISDYKGATGEITSISDAHRQARLLALSRTFLSRKRRPFKRTPSSECTPRRAPHHDGRAREGRRRRGRGLSSSPSSARRSPRAVDHSTPRIKPIITDLTGQDLSGSRPRWIRALRIPLRLLPLPRVARHGVGRLVLRGGELDAATQAAVETARHTVATRVIEQAKKFHSEFVVGSDIKVSVREVPCGYAGCELNDMDVDVVWFGTGIRRIPGFKPSTHANIPPLILLDDAPRRPAQRHRRRRRRVERRSKNKPAKRRSAPPRRPKRAKKNDGAPQLDPARSGAPRRSAGARARASHADAWHAFLHQRSLGERVPARQRDGVRAAGPRDGQLYLSDQTRPPQACPAIKPAASSRE